MYVSVLCDCSHDTMDNFDKIPMWFRFSEVIDQIFNHAHLGVTIRASLIGVFMSKYLANSDLAIVCLDIDVEIKNVMC